MGIPYREWALVDTKKVAFLKAQRAPGAHFVSSEIKCTPGQSPFCLLSKMNNNPEVENQKSSLLETGKFLLGTLAKTYLKIAILEAEDAREPIDLQLKKLLKERFSEYDPRFHVDFAYRLFCFIWRQEKETPPPNLTELERKTPGRKQQLVNQKIINPLYEICARIEGEKPNLSRLGQSLIDAALKKEGTEEICSHLSKFYLDPKELVQEVYDALTAIGERDKMSLT